MVTGINYAGLESDAGYELNRSQATSAGSLLSFTTGDAEVSNAIVAASKLFKVTVSFGGCVSLMSMPCYMSHASIPKEVREARGLPDDLIRISAGIENIDDLIKDLSTALDAGAALKAAKGNSDAQKIADAHKALDEGSAMMSSAHGETAAAKAQQR